MLGLERFDRLHNVRPGIEALAVAPAVHLLPLHDAACDQLRLLGHAMLGHDLDQLLLVPNPVLLQEVWEC